MTPLDRAVAFVLDHGRDVVQNIYHDGDVESGPFVTTSYYIRLGRVMVTISPDRRDAYVMVPNNCARDDLDPCVRMVADPSLVERVRNRISDIRDRDIRSREARAREASYAEA